MDCNDLALFENICSVCFSVPMVLFIDLEMLLRFFLAGVCIFSGQKHLNKPLCLSLYYIQYNLSIVSKDVLLSLVCLYCSFSIWLFLMILNTLGFECQNSALNIEFMCNKTQRVHWLSVRDDVWSLNFFLFNLLSLFGSGSR